MKPMVRVILGGVAVGLVSAVTAVLTTLSLRPGAWGWAAAVDQAEQIFPVGSAEQLLWPIDRAWVYSVRLGEAGPKSGVRAEVRTAGLGTNEGYAFGQVARGAPGREGPSVEWQTVPDTATVSVQVVGAGEGPAGGDRDHERLIVRLKAGSIAVAAEIPMEGTYAGHGGNGYAQWVNGELHLMNVFARSGDVVTRYDVLLSESPNERTEAFADDGGR